MAEICVGLKGGLGNQLFQYAAGRALAARHGADLTLHPGPPRSGIRSYALGELGIDAVLRAPTGLRAKLWHRMQNVRRAVGLIEIKTPLGWHGPVWREREIGYDPRIEELEPPAYLSGFFQSPRYFSGIADGLRAELRAELERHRPDGIPEGAISLHCRRGDYLAEEVAGIHSTLERDYYVRALAKIRKTAPDAPVLLFSDDLKAAREMLAGLDVRAVEGGSRVGDLAGMAACRHHIIANSTFGWWGAWIGDGGTTVAPRDWYRGGAKPQSLTAALYEESWHVV